MRKLLALILLLILTSCSTQKVKNKEVEQTKTETETIVEDKTVINTNTEVTEVKIDTTQTSEIIIEPIDSTKEFIVNGKTYKNARIRTKKVINGQSINKTEKVAKIEEKDVKTDIKAKTQTKKVISAKEKKTSYNTLIYIIGFVIILVIAFFLWYFGFFRRRNMKT